MMRKVAWLAVLGLFVSVPARAQDARLEISGTYGWNFSDGVSGDGVLADDGNIYDRLDPRDSTSYSLSVGYFASENLEIGFLWGRQGSTLEAGGTSTVEIGDVDVDNYHGYIAYNFGDMDAPVRPYFLGGAGVTRYGSVTFNGLDGGLRETDSASRFSTTWGVGVKVYPGAGNFGLRAGLRWTPTYIKSDAAGWWCDPFWGCYVVGNAQYSNQFEFSGGLSLRF